MTPFPIKSIANIQRSAIGKDVTSAQKSPFYQKEKAPGENSRRFILT
jgi:hypothetical protein